MSGTQSTEAALAAIARIRRLIELLPSLGADGEWFAPKLALYLEHAREGLTVDEAIGVATPSCGRGWWYWEDQRAQDEALSALAEVSMPGPGRSLEESIAAMLGTYRKGRYPVDVQSGGEWIPDKKRRLMHDVLCLRSGNTPSAITIKRRLKRRDKTSPKS